MIIEKRLDAILKIVNERESVTVQELTEYLKASESTIRRDLTILHNDGRLKKVHGGATALGVYQTRDEDIELRQNSNREEKIAIVKYAASLIKPNDFVYIDAGTTTELLIDYITEKNALYVTNGISHGKKLVQNGCGAHILGGRLKLATEAMVGNETLFTLEHYNFTIGFWGTNGISLKQGFSTPDIDEAMIKRKAMEQCKKRYVLSDPTKFNQISAVTFSNFKDATIITTKVEQKEYVSCQNIFQVGK